MLNHLFSEVKQNNRIKRAIKLLMDTPIFPKPIQRTVQAQKIVDKDCEKLRLYHLSSCPFCIKVRLKIKQLALKIELLDLNENNNREELIEKGGKAQVPCLRVILEKPREDKFIYESDVINRYLEENFKLFKDI